MMNNIRVGDMPSFRNISVFFRDEQFMSKPLTVNVAAYVEVLKRIKESPSADKPYYCDDSFLGYPGFGWGMF